MYTLHMLFYACIFKRLLVHNLCTCVHVCAYMCACAYMYTHGQRHIHMYNVIILSSDAFVQRKRNILLRVICMPSELVKLRAVPEPSP